MGKHGSRPPEGSTTRLFSMLTLHLGALLQVNFAQVLVLVATMAIPSHAQQLAFLVGCANTAHMHRAAQIACAIWQSIAQFFLPYRQALPPPPPPEPQEPKEEEQQTPIPCCGFGYDVKNDDGETTPTPWTLRRIAPRSTTAPALTNYTCLPNNGTTTSWIGVGFRPGVPVGPSAQPFFENKTADAFECVRRIVGTIHWPVEVASVLDEVPWLHVCTLGTLHVLRWLLSSIVSILVLSTTTVIVLVGVLFGASESADFVWGLGLTVVAAITLLGIVWTSWLVLSMTGVRFVFWWTFQLEQIQRMWEKRVIWGSAYLGWTWYWAKRFAAPILRTAVWPWLCVPRMIFRGMRSMLTRPSRTIAGGGATSPTETALLRSFEKFTAELKRISEHQSQVLTQELAKVVKKLDAVTAAHPPSASVSVSAAVASEDDAKDPKPMKERGRESRPNTPRPATLDAKVVAKAPCSDCGAVHARPPCPQCYICRKKGHQGGACPTATGRCRRCGREGHRDEACPLLDCGPPPELSVSLSGGGPPAPPTGVRKWFAGLMGNLVVPPDEEG